MDEELEECDHDVGLQDSCGFTHATAELDMMHTQAQLEQNRVKERQEQCRSGRESSQSVQCGNGGREWDGCGLIMRRCSLQSALWDSVVSRTTAMTGPGVRTLLRFRISASGAFGFGYVTATG